MSSSICHLRRPVIYIRDILRWADAFHAHWQRWPKAHSGSVTGQVDETWSRIDNALKGGFRGLPGGSSLARLLAQFRGVRNKARLPRLTVQQILAWADAHHARTGAWPNRDSGAVSDDPNEKWPDLDGALKRGRRGLPRSTLASVLAEHRGVRNLKALTDLSIPQILAWADAHHARTRRWPVSNSGPVTMAPGETWTAVQMALHHGRRGLPGGSSLPQLLTENRGVRNRRRLPRLSVSQILAWADAHRQRTGQWPRKTSGPVLDTPGEKWSAIDAAIAHGSRGLAGGSSLPRLLAEHRGVRNPMGLPHLSAKKILRWADTYFRRTGRWPTADAGSIPGAGAETWLRVDAALRMGLRGLVGKSSLPRLLAEHRGVRNRGALPRLTIRKILDWADTYYERVGRWPSARSGPIDESAGETWQRVDAALCHGLRGLAGGDSLARFLARQRGVSRRK